MSGVAMDLFEAEVTRVERLSRDFVRISLASAGLTGLVAPAGDGAGPVRDAYLKLLIPHPEAPGPVRFALDEAWRREWFAAGPRERGGWMRTYTLRAARAWEGPDGAPGVEVDVDFVLHGHDDAAGMGPGAAWAASAEPGAALSFIAPTREGRLWAMWEPGDAETVLVCADETAVPAAISVLGALPEGSSARLLLELPAGNEALGEAVAGEVEEARRAADVELVWLPRGADDVRGEPTLRALRDCLGLAPHARDRDVEELRAERVGAEEIVWGLSEDPRGLYVYLAGEASVVRAARRVCVDEAGIAKSSVSFMGYWKAGRAES